MHLLAVPQPGTVVMPIACFSACGAKCSAYGLMKGLAKFFFHSLNIDGMGGAPPKEKLSMLGIELGL
eukprot:13524705-Ditylum_brightwellii.AAC.1